MTKEELIGRKFNTIHDNNTYSIEEGTKELFSIRWTENSKPNFQSNLYTLEDINRFVRDNIWKLLPEENKMYQTPKGIKYGVGTKYSPGDKQIVLQMRSINNGNITVDKLKPKFVENYTLSDAKQVEEFFDSGAWIIIQDYQSLDPSTIKFDFTNTKWLVNKEEYDWLIKVANANGWTSYSSLTDIQKHSLYFWPDKDICWGDISDWNDNEYKEITIQDILNNQMKEVIEVGDKVRNKKYHEYQYEVAKIEGNIITWTVGSFDYLSDFHKTYEIVSKANKQEIIGYELLKDLPGIPAGTKSKSMTTYEALFEVNVAVCTFATEKLQDTTWFKPIYKAKKIVAKISKGREVKITKDAVTIKGQGNLNSKSIAHLYNSVCKTSKLEEFDITITQFKVGCQEFTNEDIEAVYQEILKLNK